MQADAQTFGERTVNWLVGYGPAIVGIIVLAVVVRWLANRLIARVVRTVTSKHASRLTIPKERQGDIDTRRRAHERHVQRATTLASLMRSIVTVVVATLAVLTIMSLIGAPLAPLLTSAGIGGVALGFGAQSLVKDFLSGVFMIVEDQYGVGDTVDLGEAVGEVEEVSLRVTRLRDANGTIWYVRNGEILRVGNKSQGWSTALVDISVAYDEDSARVLDVIRGVVATVDTDPAWRDKLVGVPEVLGIESLTGTSMTVRVKAETLTGEHFAVARELRERVKAALDSAGIKAPPPAVVGGVGPVGGSVGPVGGSVGGSAST